MKCTAIRFLLALFFSAHWAIAPLSANPENDAEWARLNEELAASQSELASLIQEAGARGLNTQYAEVSAHTITTFRLAAANDHRNVEEVRRIFRTFGHYGKTDPKSADRLPFNEIRGCLDVAKHAKGKLKQQLEGTIALLKAPDLSKGKVDLGPGYYRIDGRPFFPSSLVWLPSEESYVRIYGRIGQGYSYLGRLREDGSVTIDRNVKSAVESAQRNLAPYVFFTGHSPAGWMTEKHPEILHGARNFTKYDIDSPLIRNWFKQLAEASLPEWSEALGSEHPRLHLLANEPHFATRRWGWLSKNGLSDHTMAKYHDWLENKYATIAKLNEIYGTEYKAFEEVKFYKEDPKHTGDEAFRARQIDSGETRGGPIWYDWCRFNMDRVNEWFTFLKEQAQTHDGVGAPVTIKTLGFTLSRNTRDGGMDLEYLTKLQEIPGADLRVAPRGATFYGKHEEGMDPETGWQALYAYDWIEQAMFLDFTKSLCPKKVFYDSEWHGFSAVSWRDFQLDRNYVRSALWMAFMDGMGMINPWLWGRDLDGALSDKAQHIGELATQPVAVDAFGRTMKELNAHADWLAPGVQQKRHFLIYYCEEAAIQDENYTTGFKDVYEALKISNHPVGFTTPSEIGGLDSKTQTVIVSPTRFIAEDSLKALQEFQDANGRIVLVGAAEESFQKNELGQQRSGNGITSPFTSVPQGNAIELVESLNTALAPILPARPMEIAVTDESGTEALGIIIKQVQPPKTGRLILVLNNISRDRRVATLERQQGQAGELTDILTGRSVPERLLLDPCDVRVITLETR